MWKQAMIARVPDKDVARTRARFQEEALSLAGVASTYRSARTAPTAPLLVQALAAAEVEREGATGPQDPLS